MRSCYIVIKICNEKLLSLHLEGLPAIVILGLEHIATQLKSVSRNTTCMFRVILTDLKRPLEGMTSAQKPMYHVLEGTVNDVIPKAADQISIATSNHVRGSRICD